MRILLAGLLIICGVMMSCATQGMPSGREKPMFTKHFGDSLFKITDKGFFSVEIVKGLRELGMGKDTVGLIIHDRNDTDVDEADVYTIEETPQQRGDYLDRIPLTGVGSGLYVSDSINLSRQGNWQLHIRIRRGYTEDGVTFAFPELAQKRLPRGKYDDNPGQ